MLLKKLISKIRRWRTEQYCLITGWAFHHSGKQIVVTKNELRNQLEMELWTEENLLRCIAIGRNNADYKTYLYLVCLKFEFVSGLIYVTDLKNKNSYSKLKEKEYRYVLFDRFCNSLKETKDCLEMLKINVSKEQAERVYKTYKAVSVLCCHMFAHKGDTAYAHEFAHYIDYIIETGGNVFPEYEFSNSLFPINITLCYPETEMQEKFERFNFRN